MAKVAVFIADGSEEVEAITPVDLLRRAKAEVDIVSIMPTLEIEASRGLKIKADKLIGDIDFDDYDFLILPGGVKGTNNLNACELLKENVVKFNEQGKGIGAICAAPIVFAGQGILNGKNATLTLENAQINTSVDFGLAVVAYLFGEEAREELRKNIRFGAL